MMVYYDAVEVSAIKLAVGNTESLGVCSKDVLIKSIQWLLQSYERFKQREYLVKAVWIVYAYLELGYDFHYGDTEFKRISEYLEESLETLFPVARWQSEKVILNKTNIRRVIGRWNPVLHSMKISDVVEDIFTKASDRVEGESLYYCGKVIARSDKKTLWEQTFKLVIDKDSVLFHDINKNKYYVFVKKGERTND